MGRHHKRDDDGLIDVLFDLFKDYPPVGVVGAVLLAIPAAYLQWSSPTALFGMGRIFACLLWMLSLLALAYAAIGYMKLRQRGGRFQAARTIDDVRAMNWREFEQLVADLFRRQGYRVEETGQTAGGDGGVDLVLRDGKAAAHLVQCKHYREWKVTLPQVREFFGAMAAHATRCEGIYVTCGQFTEDARAFAADKPIRLIDGNELLSLLADGNVLTPAVQTYTAAGPVATMAPPRCPGCGGPMVRRLAKKGRNAGTEFWGCANWPKCAGTRALVG